MLRRIFHSLITRLATALGSFGIVWLTARYLGAAGRGAVSLFVTDCALLVLFVGFVGGASLIYLAPRRNVWNLLIPAYLWASIVCMAGAGGIWLWRDVPLSYAGHVWGVCLLQAFFSVNANLLLGRRRERAYNSLTILQISLQASLLLLAFAVGRWRDIQVYYYAAYVAQGIPLLLSLRLLYRLPDRRQLGRRLWATARELAQHSRGAHPASIMAFVNYRLSYYFVAYYTDARALGILSVGVALAEAVRLIPRSTSQIQYVDLLYTTDKAAQVAPTLRGMRLTLLLATAALLALGTLPANWLGGIFGTEFGSSRPIILLLAPGILASTLSIVCGAYFAALGHYRVNNLAAGWGLLVTVPACWLLIPIWGILGAAASMSLSYLISTGYLLWVFRRVTGTQLASLLPGRPEALALKQRLLIAVRG